MKQAKKTFKNVKYFETLALYAGLFLFFAPPLVPVSTSLPKQFAVSLNVTIASFIPRWTVGIPLDEPDESCVGMVQMLT